MAVAVLFDAQPHTHAVDNHCTIAANGGLDAFPQGTVSDMAIAIHHALIELPDRLALFFGSSNHYVSPSS
jgi:hypothetical protein